MKLIKKLFKKETEPVDKYDDIKDILNDLNIKDKSRNPNEHNFAEDEVDYKIQGYEIANEKKKWTKKKDIDIGNDKKIDKSKWFLKK